MKKKISKIVILISIIGLMTGCKKEIQHETKKVTSKEATQNIVEPKINDNSIDIGLYENEEGTRVLVETLNIPFPQLQDIIVLETYYTKDKTLIQGKQKELWDEYKKKYENIDDYKVGYHIQFKTNKEEINKTILNPKDVESFFNYIQIYLYDDIHQTNSWYSHVEKITEETILTSIKLTGSIYIDQVISPIRLKVFTYQEKDLDNQNNYTGNNQYEIIINKK